MDYQDFAQEVFVRLFSWLPALHNPKAFPGYFRRVALSVVADTFRRSKPQIQPHDPALLDVLEAADAAILDKIFVASYLSKLQPKEREVLTLEYMSGYSPAEIAPLVGLKTAGGVRMIKSRAMKRLHEIVEAERTLLGRQMEHR